MPPDGLIDETSDLTEISYGDDVDLDTNDNATADSLQYGFQGAVNAREQDAWRLETVFQHMFAPLDWGSPGKQHKSENNYAD